MGLSHLTGAGEASTLENCTGWELLMCTTLPASQLAANSHNDNTTGRDISGKDTEQ